MSDRVLRAVVTTMHFLLPVLCNPLLHSLEWRLHSFPVVFTRCSCQGKLCVIMGDIWLEKILRLLNQPDSLTCTELSCPNVQFVISLSWGLFFVLCWLLCSNLKQDSIGNSLPGKGSSSKVDDPGIMDQFSNCSLYETVPAWGIVFSVSAAGFISIKRIMSNTQLGSIMCRKPSSVCVWTGQQTSMALCSGWFALVCPGWGTALLSSSSWHLRMVALSGEWIRQGLWQPSFSQH